MNIVVCVKWVPDNDSPIKIENGVVKSLCYVVNPCDLVAVEEAVRLKERHGPGEVTLICTGGPLAKKGLRRCLAIGADRAILLYTGFDNWDSHATATILAKAISWLKHDLVLCGERAIDTEAGQVGAILAATLDIPMISSAMKVDVSPDGKKVLVHRKLQRGNRDVVEASLPALLTVESGLNKPRYPGFRAIQAAERKEIEEKALNLIDEGARASKTRIVSFSLFRQKPKKIFTPDSRLSPQERMQLVMSGGVTEKKGDLLQGNVRDLALNVVGFLTETCGDYFLNSEDRINPDNA